MKKQKITDRRPAETKTGAVGGGALLVISLLEAFHVTVTGAWLKVITAVVALAPAGFTWLKENDGIRGVVHKLLGADEVHPRVAA